MGLLVGLPLKLFHILFVVLRFAWPLVLALILYHLMKRLRGGPAPRWHKADPDEPEFDGPVYTVDYKIVEEEQTEDGP